MAKKDQTPKPVTPSYLRNYAAWYLERFTCSRAHLTGLMRRKIALSARIHGTDAQEAESWIVPVLDDFTALGALDDRAYARGRALSMHRRGKPTSMISSDLKARGVPSRDIEAALAAVAEEAGLDPDTAAAVSYAKRRRLGVYRTREPKEDTERKELAAMARAGFGFDLARKVLAGEVDEGEGSW